MSLSSVTARFEAKARVQGRLPRHFKRREGEEKVTDYFGRLTFDVLKADTISQEAKKAISESISSEVTLDKRYAQQIADAVLDWAISQGATHFCHWFQPLTGSTAEKHDAFLDFDHDKRPIEKLSVTQLMQGEPDASSFPNGGSRSTFEARGYTSWDLTSPLFIMNGTNGKTLCIPTAFVSYRGDALDMKTPLLRSCARISEVAQKFLRVIGEKEENIGEVIVNCGPEQEYFLVDKDLYYLRPDLVMTGRALFGAPTAKNQQLDDHYFGPIDHRTLAFMEELDYELHCLGVAAKTRHNEVAPGQFELAAIFRDANLASDQNQLVMATIKTVALKHNFVALLHEKPFAGINGSGKHLNWSLSTEKGLQLFGPGERPHENMRFLAMVSAVVDMVHQHAPLLRMSIASAGNDHRLGANEAPPSIVSVYIGETLEKIFQSIQEGTNYVHAGEQLMELGTGHLAKLLRDNSDRNRTSPFAFTGNKFELRAAGSSQAIGLPLTILNGAFADVLEQATHFLEEELSKGKSSDEALLALIKRNLTRGSSVIFNGDGYSSAWPVEAKKRGLPNLRSTADALYVLKDPEQVGFLVEQGVCTEVELETRYHVSLERYNTLRTIELETLKRLAVQYVLPSSFNYKSTLLSLHKDLEEMKLNSKSELHLLKKLNFHTESLSSLLAELDAQMEKAPESDVDLNQFIATDLMEMMDKISNECSEIESLIPSDQWSLPTFYDLLFVR